MSHSALEFVFSTWADNQESFYGSYDIKIRYSTCGALEIVQLSSDDNRQFLNAILYFSYLKLIIYSLNAALTFILTAHLHC